MSYIKNMNYSSGDNSRIEFIDTLTDFNNLPHKRINVLYIMKDTGKQYRYDNTNLVYLEPVIIEDLTTNFYTKTESDNKYLQNIGGTLTGNLTCLDLFSQNFETYGTGYIHDLECHNIRCNLGALFMDDLDVVKNCQVQGNITGVNITASGNITTIMDIACSALICTDTLSVIGTLSCSGASLTGNLNMNNKDIYNVKDITLVNAGATGFLSCAEVRCTGYVWAGSGIARGFNDVCINLSVPNLIQFNEPIDTLDNNLNCGTGTIKSIQINTTSLNAKVSGNLCLYIADTFAQFDMPLIFSTGKYLNLADGYITTTGNLTCGSISSTSINTNNSNIVVGTGTISSSNEISGNVITGNLIRSNGNFQIGNGYLFQRSTGSTIFNLGVNGVIEFEETIKLKTGNNLNMNGNNIVSCNKLNDQFINADYNLLRRYVTSITGDGTAKDLNLWINALDRVYSYFITKDDIVNTDYKPLISENGSAVMLNAPFSIGIWKLFVLGAPSP